MDKPASCDIKNQYYWSAAFTKARNGGEGFWRYDYYLFIVSMGLEQIKCRANSRTKTVQKSSS